MVSLIEGEWLCYVGGQLNGERMVMLQDGWMNSVLGHFYALSRLNWTGTTWANEMNFGWLCQRWSLMEGE